MDDPDRAEPPPRKYKLKPREFARVNAPPGTDVPSAAHDVYAILRANRTREQDHRLGEVEIKTVKSRRRRDYWRLLLGTNLFLALIAWFGRENLFVLVSAAAGVVISSIGLTWVMWFVMDDY